MQRTRANIKWGLLNSGDDPMAKELRTARELSDMIVSSLGTGEVEIQIRNDHVCGWQPTVVACPGDLIRYQRRVEEIANRLRAQFALRE
jgi:hypothetical protein